MADGELCLLQTFQLLPRGDILKHHHDAHWSILFTDRTGYVLTGNDTPLFAGEHIVLYTVHRSVAYCSGKT